MKWLPAFCCLLLCWPAFAQDAAKPIPLRQAPPNVEIINGKKFFSLSNARRFTGGPNNPGAMSVMHHPRPEGTIASRRLGQLPFVNSHTAPKASSGTGGASGAEAGTPQDSTNKDTVLSIFAPEDRTSSPTAR